MPFVAQNVVGVTFKVNGTPQTLQLDSHVVQLDALRERLALTGSKKGCDQGQYGAYLALRLANYAEVDPESGKPFSSKALREC